MEKNTVYSKYAYAKISPKKAWSVLGLVRGKPALEAVRILKFDTSKAAKMSLKVLKTAMANAKNAHNMKEENLVVSEVYADAGPMAKRNQPMGRGRSGGILKRTSHIVFGLSERKKK